MNAHYIPARPTGISDQRYVLPDLGPDGIRQADIPNLGLVGNAVYEHIKEAALCDAQVLRASVDLLVETLRGRAEPSLE